MRFIGKYVIEIDTVPILLGTVNLLDSGALIGCGDVKILPSDGPAFVISLSSFSGTWKLQNPDYPLQREHPHGTLLATILVEVGQPQKTFDGERDGQLALEIRCPLYLNQNDFKGKAILNGEALEISFDRVDD